MYVCLVKPFSLFSFFRMVNIMSTPDTSSYFLIPECSDYHWWKLIQPRSQQNFGSKSFPLKFFISTTSSSVQVSILFKFRHWTRNQSLPYNRANHRWIVLWTMLFTQQGDIQTPENGPDQRSKINNLLVDSCLPPPSSISNTENHLPRHRLSSSPTSNRDVKKRDFHQQDRRRHFYDYRFSG